MITVLDPLFKPTGDPIASTALATKIPEEASAIAGAMGCPTIETLTIGTGLTEAILKKINDNLYSDKAKFIIPILLETPTDGKLGNTYTNCYVSYLVISPRCLTPKTVPVASGQEDTLGTFSVTTKNGTVIKGTGAATDSLTADQVNLQSLFKPGIDANGNSVPVAANAIEAVGLRLTNYRLYRNGKDDYPITFDDIDSLFYGYKETGSTINEVVITNSKFSLSLVQQVLLATNYNMFPIFPTNYDEYLVKGEGLDAIKAIGESNSNFDYVAVAYTIKDGSSTSGLGLSGAIIEKPDGYFYYLCHIYEKIYLLTTN